MSEDWKSTGLRQKIIGNIEEELQKYGTMGRTSIEIEDSIFKRSKTKEEYLQYVARIMLHMRDLNQKQKGTGMVSQGQNLQDPINALQSLAVRQNNSNPQLTSALNAPVGSGPGPMGNPNMMNTSVANMANIANQTLTIQGTQITQNPGMPTMTSQLQQPPASQAARMPNLLNSLRPTDPQRLNMIRMQQQQAAGPQPGLIMNPGQTNQVNQLMQQMQQRKTETMAQTSTQFVNNPQLVGQSPNPGVSTAMSPATAALQGNMVPSPAYAPSPSSQLAPSPAPRPGSVPPYQGRQNPSSVPSPSPSGPINTPMGAGVSASPRNQQEEQVYLDKVRQLSKYIEPLRSMINKMGGDEEGGAPGMETTHTEKLGKMKKLLDILSNPNQRMPMDTLLKCEQVLEKMDLTKSDTCPREPTSVYPLVDAVKYNMKSPMFNHTMQRTFMPALEVLYGPEIKCPMPSKRLRVKEPEGDIPNVLQGEIARLDQRFKVNLSVCQPHGSQSLHLTCHLDDRNLPCVPPISIIVPQDYPASVPLYQANTMEAADSTPFLQTVHKALEVRLSKLPSRYTVSQILDTWEMSVRQACCPRPVHVNSLTVAMGL